jgi:hypothetical protein
MFASTFGAFAVYSGAIITACLWFARATTIPLSHTVCTITRHI